MAQMLPSGPGLTVWEKANMPPPKFLITLPSADNSQIGFSSEPRHPLSMQRSITQTLSFASTKTLLVGAQLRGMCSQPVTCLYGLGRSLRQGPLWAWAAAAKAVVANSAIVSCLICERMAVPPWGIWRAPYMRGDYSYTARAAGQGSPERICPVLC